MLESNPPRNSWLETHRDDERGSGDARPPLPVPVPHRIDRSPDA